MFVDNSWEIRLPAPSSKVIATHPAVPIRARLSQSEWRDFRFLLLISISTSTIVPICAAIISGPIMLLLIVMGALLWLNAAFPDWKRYVGALVSGQPSQKAIGAEKHPNDTVHVFDEADPLLNALVIELEKSAGCYMSKRRHKRLHSGCYNHNYGHCPEHMYSVWHYMGQKERELMERHTGLVNDYLQDVELRDSLELIKLLDDSDEDRARKANLWRIIEGAARTTCASLAQAEEARLAPERLEAAANLQSARERADAVIANPPQFYQLPSDTA